jgi:rubrerythrin
VEQIHNEELNDLYCSPNIRVIKSRRMRLVGYIARMEKGAYRVLVGKPEGKKPHGDPGVDGWVLKWICKECGEGRGLD